MVLFGLILFGTLYASYTWISVSFFSLGMFSALHLQICFLPPFLPSAPETPITWTLVHLMSQRSVLTSYSFFFFYLASVISTTLSSAGWFIPESSNLLLIPYSVFFHFTYCILHLWLVFFMFSHSLLKTSHFSLCSSVLSWGLWSSLWSWPWTLYQVDRLSPLSLSSSGVFISFLHLEHVLLSPNLQFLFLCIW